jgi:hypothetical protein
MSLTKTTPSYGHPSAGGELVSERGEIATWLVRNNKLKIVKAEMDKLILIVPAPLP